MTTNWGRGQLTLKSKAATRRDADSLEEGVNSSLMKYSQDKCQMPSPVPARQSPAAVRLGLGSSSGGLALGTGGQRAEPGPLAYLGSSKGQQCLESREQVIALRASGG